ncbi:MAG: hypothetical protein JO032_07200, partial [Alphaproteobacteria bacterium]|nr:hypothetical protein [Alphaproteobacteria bacterium]
MNGDRFAGFHAAYRFPRRGAAPIFDMSVLSGERRQMMTPRQQAFRIDYRARISPWYSGLAHVVVIALIGVMTICYAAGHMYRPTLAEWLVVPATFLGCNLFEWALHRFLLHRPVPGFMGIYKRHTLAHHQFFTDNEPT